MEDPSPSDSTAAAQIAELRAAIRYWDAEAERGTALAAEKAEECRDRLAALTGGGIENAGC